MARNYTASAGGMLNDLKSRLGFGNNDDDSRYDSRRSDSYDDYDEFEEYGEGYDDGANDPLDGGYTRTTRTPRERYEEAQAQPRAGLVSIDDVKSFTREPDRIGGSYADGRPSSRYSARTVLDETVPPVSSPAHNAALRDSRTRSEGVDSLFEPTAPIDDTPEGFAPIPNMSSSRSYDPYEAYSGTGASSYSPTRSLTVIKPTVYGDVERVSKAVKMGDVVVLVMRNTPESLLKRILDFSFGVASALDASVECPGDKVFAIARGNALTEEEKRRLRNQGAL